MYKYDFEKEMAAKLILPLRHIRILVARAPYSYKKYHIAKKNGGERLIAQPAKEIKIIQYYLLQSVFSALPVHECAMAYKKGASIKINASRHKNNQFISKFDFKDFFGSISEKNVYDHMNRFISDKVTEKSISDIARVCCVNKKENRKLCLSIGAPSSPVLSNSIMYNFDCKVSSWCAERNIVYTRYADDLTFSTDEPNILKEIEKELLKIINDIAYPTLFLNNKKTIHLSKKNQRRITGLVISNDNNISLGRDKKRLISSMVHHYIQGKLTEDNIYKLQGLLGFAKDAEFIFVNRLSKKYSSEVISSILKFRKSKE